MSVLSLELKRALGNRWFVLSLGILTAIALFGAAVRSYVIAGRLNIVTLPYIDTTYWYLSAFSSFTSWIAVNHLDTATELFFVLVPLLVLMGYSWSLASDLKSGYFEQLVTRAPRRRCYTARLLATFTAGGLLVVVPLVLNLMLLSLFLPSWNPDVVDMFYTTVGGASDVSNNAIFTSLFYANPALFVAARVLLDYVLCGLWATTVLALSIFIRNRVALIVVPYIMLLLAKHLGQRLYVAMRTNGHEGFGFSLTLFDQLRAAPDGFYCPGWLTLLCIALMLGISLGLPLLARKKDIL